MSDTHDLLTTPALAEYVGVPVQTVYRWATDGTGPRGIRVGRRTLYRMSDVQAWLDSRYADRATA